MQGQQVTRRASVGGANNKDGLDLTRNEAYGLICQGNTAAYEVSDPLPMQGQRVTRRASVGGANNKDEVDLSRNEA